MSYALAEAAGKAQFLKYTNVASGVILAFDYFETLEREVELIWKSQWNMGKVLFILARYPTFVGISLAIYFATSTTETPAQCGQVHTVMSGFAIVGITMAQAILVLRTYALWTNDLIILAFLCVLYVGETVTMIVTTIVYERAAQWAYIPAIGCYVSKGSGILFANCVVIMVLETTILLLTLWVGFRKHNFDSPNRLVTVLTRDGIIYFFSISMLAFASMLLYLLAPPQLAGILVAIQKVMHSVISTRIVLNVRKRVTPRTATNIVADFHVWTSLGQTVHCEEASTVDEEDSANEYVVDHLR